MKYRYSKFVADLARRDRPRVAAVSQLSDLLLSSGFNNPWDPQSDDDRTMQALHDAILDALLNGGVLSDEMLERLLDRPARRPEERQAQRDQIEAAGPADHRAADRAGLRQRDRAAGRAAARRRRRRGGRRRQRGSRSPTRRSTSSAIARCATCSDRWAAAAPAGTTRASCDTGIEAGGPPRAVRVRRHAESRRRGDGAERGQARMSRPGSGAAPAQPGIDVDYEDLMITQGDYQSSCATVHPARLQPQHGALRRGSVHAGQARGAGAREPDPPSVPRRRAERRAVPRLGRGSAARAARPRARRARTTRTRAKACGWRAACSIGSARTCGRSS